MIPVTRLDGSSIVLNAEHIERIERTPDTLIALINGETYLVQESPEELIDRVVGYKRLLQHDPARHLSLARGAQS